LKQAITRFNQDELGDRVAELACDHAQHVRHKPPWQNSPWVMSKDGRNKMIGQLLECRLCDRLMNGDEAD